MFRSGIVITPPDLRREIVAAPNLVSKWPTWAPQLLSVLRIVAAFMFMLAGSSKLFAFPVGMPPDGSTAKFMSQIWIGGVLVQQPVSHRISVKVLDDNDTAVFQAWLYLGQQVPEG